MYSLPLRLFPSNVSSLKRWRFLGATLLFILAGLSIGLMWVTDKRGPGSPSGLLHPASSRAKPNPGTLDATYARLPLHFERNEGQVDSQMDYVSHGAGHALFLSSRGALLSLQKSDRIKARARHSRSSEPSSNVSSPPAVVGIELVGSNPQSHAAGVEELPGKVNYYIGNDPATWRTNIPTYAKVRYQDVYPGIDIVYYGNQRRLEYDLVVTPGANPNAIALGFWGAESVAIDSAGDLVLHLAEGEVRQYKPRIYQEINGVRHDVSGGYVLKGRQVRFSVGAYDGSKPLIIDPTLAYSTFLGGDGEDPAFSIAVDPAGNVYVTGVTNSMSSAPGTKPFPIVNSWGAEGTMCCGGGDTGRAFVTKMNTTASGAAQIIYSTYLGGFAGFNGVHQKCPLPEGCGGDPRYARGWDEGFGIAADTAGNTYVVGQAESLDFPTTADAVRRSHPGPTFTGQTSANSYLDHPRDGFLAKFGPTGALIYSSLIGGHGSDTAQSVAVIDSGSFQGIYLAGEAQSVDFFGGSPGTGNYPSINSFQSQLNVNPTYVTNPTPPASCHDAASPGATVNNWACWRDGWAMRLTLDGKTVIYSTFVGGTGDDGAIGITVDPATGNAAVVGETESTDFPSTAGVVQPCHNGNGGYPSDLTLQTAGMAPFSCHLSPSPQTADYPTQTNKPPVDAWAAKFGPTGSLLFLTYLGGSSDDNSGATQDDLAGDFGRTVAMDNSSDVYVTGWTESFDSTKPASNPPGSPPGAINGQATNCGPIPPNANAQTGNQPCPVYVGFPTTPGAFQTNLAQDPTTTCGSGSPSDCVPPNKRAHANTYVAELNPMGTAFVYSTYIGGFGDDASYGIAVDSLGQAYIAGASDSTNYPITAGKTIAHPGCATCGANINGVPPPYNPDNPPQFTDAFVTKLNPTGAGLIYSSYFGGSGDETAHGIVHSTRAGAFGVYVVGLSTSSSTAPPPKPPDPPGTNPPTPPWPNPWYGFPTTPDAYQATSSPTRTTRCDGGPPTSEKDDYPCPPLPSIPNEETFIARLNDNADESPAPPVSGTPQGPSFTVAATPSSLSINKNGSGMFDVSVTPDAGFSGNVTLTHSSNPATGLTITPASAASNSPGYPGANFTVSASSAAAGTYTITVTGTSGTITRTTTVTVNVRDFTLSADPSNVSFAGDGGMGSFKINVVGQGGFTGNVALSHSSTPAGLTVTPPTATVPANGSATFQATASKQGTYTVTVTGMGTVPGIGQTTRTTTVTVKVRAPNFSLSANPAVVTFSKDGGSGKFDVSVLPVDGFNATVNLTATSTPAGLTVTPNSTTSGPPYSPISFTATSTTPGNYTVTLKGTGTDSWNGKLVTVTKKVTVRVADNTSFRSPSANSAANTSGDGNGFEVSPTNAYANDSLFAVDNNSGLGTGATCASENKDSHRFFNYGLTVPAGKTITGIEVRVDAKVDSAAGTPKMCVQLSSNNGGSWTAAKSTPLLTTSEGTYILGGVTDTWGRAWSNGNVSVLQVNVIDVSSDVNRDFFLDWIAVNVHYR